jgi:hypothetical protein
LCVDQAKKYEDARAELRENQLPVLASEPPAPMA